MEHFDLTGRAVVVVGANVGLGFEAEKHFASMNPKEVGGRVSQLGEDVPTPSLVNSSRGADHPSCRPGKFTACLNYIWPSTLSRSISTTRQRLRTLTDSENVGS